MPFYVFETNFILKMSHLLYACLKLKKEQLYESFEPRNRDCICKHNSIIVWITTFLQRIHHELLHQFFALVNPFVSIALFHV